MTYKLKQKKNARERDGRSFFYISFRYVYKNQPSELQSGGRLEAQSH